MVGVIVFENVKHEYLVPGEDGFPGQVNVSVKYRLSSDHRLTFDFQATATKATPINMTNHTYFNLSGAVSESILDHELQVSATQYLPLDDELIPTGQSRRSSLTLHCSSRAL